MHSAAANGNADSYFDYICVVDFEATCEENNPPDYRHEIIEFPMVLIDTHTLEIVSWWRNGLANMVPSSIFSVNCLGIDLPVVKQWT